MAACGESPMLLESLSPWKRMSSMKTIDHYSFTEIFGVLYFKDSNIHVDHDPPHLPISSSSSLPPSSPSSSSSSNSVSSAGANTPVSAIDISKIDFPNGEEKHYRRSDSISSTKSICTEGLGSESSDEVEDLLKNENPNNDRLSQEEIKTSCTRTEYENHWGESKRSRRNIGEFPPPISCIGRNGKPWVYFKSFRQDGRFILKEIRIPTQEFLHACRENGRLKLQLIQSDDEISEDDEENDEEDDDTTSLHGNGEGEKGEESEEISSCNVYVQSSS